MPRRVILTDRQRAALFDLPSDEAMILRHYILSEADLALINRRKGAANRIGFCLQLFAFRYPGRLIQPGEVIPPAMLDFAAGQLGLEPGAVARYAVTGTTHYRHSADLQRLLGYRSCAGRVLEDIKTWLIEAAGSARATVDLATACLEEMRRRAIIVPAPTTVERLCATALVTAETQAITTIAGRLDQATRMRLNTLITETTDGRVSRLVWVRQIESGRNSADMNRLLDRLDVLQELGVPDDVIAGVPPRQIEKLHGEGDRLYVDSLRKIPPDRRVAILVTSVTAWRAALLDAVIETQERILGKIFRDAQAQCAAALEAGKTPITDVLRSLGGLATALIAARRDAEDLDDAVQQAVGWDVLPDLATHAMRLTTKVDADALDHVGLGYGRIRRYGPRLLKTLRFEGSRTVQRLLAQIDILRAMNAQATRRLPPAANAGFATSKWRKRIVNADGMIDPRLWEVGLMFALRDRLRAGDVWVHGARRYKDLDAALVPASAVSRCPRLAVPVTPDPWIEDRCARLGTLLRTVGEAADRDLLSNASIRDGVLRLKRLERAVPEAASDLVADLYRRIPEVRITDLMLTVEHAVGFSDTFTELRTGAPPRDRLALLTVLLADGLNMGLGKMARACQDYSVWELTRVATWHVRQETYERALAMVVAAQAALPMARLWGEGLTSSSDGQFFPSGSRGDALNLVNARYGSEPGTKLYTHVSDQYAPFHVNQITATAFEAPYVLDGLVNTDAGRRVQEHFTDTGGFTDHLFATAAILGFAFAPRIRNLPDKRLYVFDRGDVHPALAPLVGRQVRTDVIRDCWPEVLRIAASMVTGAVVPSHLLRKLAAYPKRNALAIALREIGRIERSIFILTWLIDTALQRRQQLGLNKGEAHHALKSALCINRKGEIRDRSSDRQAVRAAGLNFLAAVVIYHNTLMLGEILTDPEVASTLGRPDLLTHASPLCWDHILLTGEYSWSERSIPSSAPKT